MDLVHSRAVRMPLVAIILSILKCMFYSRSISSAGVLTPLTILYKWDIDEKPNNQTARQEVKDTAVLLASIIYIDKTTLRIGYVQFFVRTDHDALVLSPWATRPPTGHGLLEGHGPLPPLYPALYWRNNGVRIANDVYTTRDFLMAVMLTGLLL